MMRLNRKIKATALAGVFAAAAALGMAGATAPTAQASDSDGGGTVAAPAAATVTLVFPADPALAGRPMVILAVDAQSGAAAPVASGAVAPGLNAISVPSVGSDYAVVTPEGPIWAGRPNDDDGYGL